MNDPRKLFPRLIEDIESCAPSAAPQPEPAPNGNCIICGRPMFMAGFSLAICTDCVGTRGRKHCEGYMQGYSCLFEYSRRLRAENRRQFLMLSTIGIAAGMMLLAELALWILGR